MMAKKEEFPLYNPTLGLVLPAVVGAQRKAGGRVSCIWDGAAGEQGRGVVPDRGTLSSGRWLTGGRFTLTQWGEQCGSEMRQPRSGRAGLSWAPS